MTLLIDQFGDRRQFVLAHLSPKEGGGTDKIPVSPITGDPVDGQDPANWMTGAEASACAALWGEGYGPGIVISEGSGLFCIDLDHCREGAGWAPHAHNFIARFPGAYVEVSQSGEGLHIIGSYRGEISAHRTRNKDYRCEAYTRSRFIYLGSQGQGSALTDCTDALQAFLTQFFPAHEAEDADEWTAEPVPQWSGPPDTDAGNVELIAKAKRSRSANAIFGKGASFANLWDGDPEKLYHAYPPQQAGQTWDPSAADQALANHLAYWCGGNCERIERLMKQSALYRGKHERGDYMRSTILKACASVAARGDYYNDGTKVPVTPGDTRPVIELKGGSLAQNVAALQPLLAERIYVRGGSLVRIGNAEQVANGKLVNGAVESAGTRRAAKQAVVIPVTADWLRLELMGIAQFWQYDERASRFKHKDCPEEIASLIVRQGSWSAFAPLLTITSTPILRPNLSVWRTPGYDAETGIFYQPTIDIPPIIDYPTPEDARAAVARLLEPFDQFPYASPESRAVFVAHIITAVIRASFATSPIFIYSAPIVASGKTLLSDMAAVIAQGVDHPAHHNYDEKEELRKVLFASLLAGDSALTIDNLPEGIKIRSPVLANFATSGTGAGRVLGVSKVMELPNRCTVTMTGNNVTPVGEISRRSIVCRLDVNAESARGRTFRIKNLRSYVREHRGQHIVDVLTIVRAHAFAGYPGALTPLESFEEWSALVRNPLLWLGMADPVASQATETEDEVTPLRAAFTAIAAATSAQGQKFTCEQLAALTTTWQGMPGQAPLSLRDALVAAGCKEPADPTTLRYWLRAKKDNVAAGRKLVNEVDAHTNVATWHLRDA